MTKWSEDLTCKFVEAYLKHDCLYNTKSPYYRKKNMRDSALLLISQELGIPGFGPKEVYAKLRSIKSTYSQESKKIRESYNSPAGVYVPHIKWFPIMDDALKAITEDSNETNDYMKGDSKQLLKIKKIDSEHITNVNGQHSKKQREIKSDENIRDLDHVDTKVINVTDNLTHGYNTEFDYFGSNVAAQLNNMPLPLAIEAQTYIQNYLSQIRLQQINSEKKYTRRPSSSHS